MANIQMNAMQFERIKSMLEKAGVVFDPGLTIEELHEIETRYGFRFPPDYAAFLMFGVPTRSSFVDWRHDDPKKILGRLSWPYDSMCFDIEHSNFWLRAWGPRPEQLSAAYAIAKQALDQEPTLIPIYSHRYIPDDPAEEGNPIFSVYQTDIIYYGHDLVEYFENEFSENFFGKHRYLLTTYKTIRFWSHLVDISGDNEGEDV